MRATTERRGSYGRTTVRDDERTNITFVYRQGPRYLVPANSARLVTDVSEIKLLFGIPKTAVFLV